MNKHQTPHMDILKRNEINKQARKENENEKKKRQNKIGLRACVSLGFCSMHWKKEKI